MRSGQPYFFCVAQEDTATVTAKRTKNNNAFFFFITKYFLFICFKGTLIYTETS